MKKINIKKIDEVIYYEKLDNGLKVYMYTNPNIHNNYVTYTTRYGSIYKEFKTLDGDMVKVPNGIAHFLEHKVFVEEHDPQPEEFFARSGAVCNAFTTFKNTTYLFSGPEELENNISYLIDFVGNIYLTDDNVESEKGIIGEEINMCDDTPVDRLYDKIRENTIKNNPFRESIIGTHEEVNSITKDMLETCYHTFYHPSNMFLIVTGNFNPNNIIKVIKDKFKDKEYDKREIYKKKKYKEPDKVVKEYEVIDMNTNVPKYSYNIKINVDNIKMDKRKLNIYMYLLYTLAFGETSSFDERMKKEGIITSSIYYNLLDIGSHYIISLMNNTYEYEKLEYEIEKTLSNIEIDKNDFNRKKKVLISNEIFSYEDMEMVNDMILDNILFDNKIPDDIIDIINSLNPHELEDIIKNIDFTNKAVVIIKNKKESK